MAVPKSALPTRAPARTSTEGARHEHRRQRHRPEPSRRGCRAQRAVPGGLPPSRLACLGSLATGGGRHARRGVRAQPPPANDPERALRHPGQRPPRRRTARAAAGAGDEGRPAMSMDAGSLLLPELADILRPPARDARTMPMSQVVQVLRRTGAGLGAGLRALLLHPRAAARSARCIARTRMARNWRSSCNIPAWAQHRQRRGQRRHPACASPGCCQGVDLAPLLAEAKRQFHEEADYRREAESLHRFGGLLGDAEHFVLPRAVDALTRSDILAMSWWRVAVESLAEPQAADQALRDRIAGLLIGSVPRALRVPSSRPTPTSPTTASTPPAADWCCSTSAPPGPMPSRWSRPHRRLMAGTVGGDRAAMGEAAQAIGYFQDNIHAHQSAMR